MNYGKVLGVRAQAVRGMTMDCPSLDLVLNKRKKMSFPSIIRERPGGWGRGQVAYCLSLHGPIGSESRGRECNRLVGQRE